MIRINPEFGEIPKNDSEDKLRSVMLILLTMTLVTITATQQINMSKHKISHLGKYPMFLKSMRFLLDLKTCFIASFMSLEFDTFISQKNRFVLFNVTNYLIYLFLC